MATVWRVHPKNPQQRSISQAADLLRRGGLIVCPTECSYVLLHAIGSKEAHERVLAVRDLPKAHLFTLLSASLGELASYAQVGTAEHRILRKHCPGPYTFVLPATKLVPKRFSGPRRKTIGVRISDHPVCQGLLREVGDSVITTTARLAGETGFATDSEEVLEAFDRRVDGILLVDDQALGETTIVDLVSDPPSVIRAGVGDLATLGI